MSLFNLNILTTFIALFFLGNVDAQQHSLLWQKTIGGAGSDRISEMEVDKDGNVYVVGSIQANGPYSSGDIYLSKLTKDGTTVWEKIIGASGDDNGIDLLISQENELLVLASSNSTEGYFEKGSGYEDYYLFRLSLDGRVLGVQNYGGSFLDIPTAMIQKSNGNILLYGSTRSEDGDISNNKGHFDLWLLETTPYGGIVWEKNYGGTNEDYASKIMELENGDLLLLGHSASYDEDITYNNGDFDIVMFRTTADGDLIWNKNYGGSQYDISIDFAPADNGNVMIIGNTLSNDMHVSENAGFSDSWVIEVNEEGSIEWESTFGDIGSEYTMDICQDDNGDFLIIGSTNSAVLSKAVTHGKQDIWITRLNTNREFSEPIIVGEAEFDEAAALSIHEGSILMAGSTKSTDGQVMGQSGLLDGWVLKIRDHHQTADNLPITAHPNPTTGTVYLNGLTDSDEIRVFNNSGQEIKNLLISPGFTSIVNLEGLPAGIYHVQVAQSSGIKNIKVIKR